MTPKELEKIERGLHSKDMRCPHCDLIRRLLAERREDR